MAGSPQIVFSPGRLPIGRRRLDACGRSASADRQTTSRNTQLCGKRTTWL